MRAAAAALALWAALRPGLAGAQSYNVHSPAVTGSARHVGLSGAVTAFPDGYAMTFINPAGLAGLHTGGIDFGSDSNEIENFVPNLDDPTQRSLDTSIRYSYAGARYINSKGGWGVGYVLQSPFQVDDVFLDLTTVRLPETATPPAFNNQSQVKIDVKTHTLAAASKLYDWPLAVGVGLNYTRVLESYDFRSRIAPLTNVHEEASADTWTADVGTLWRPRKWLQLGMVYKMGYKLAIDHAPNQNLPNQVQWFRDVRAPHRVNLGLAFLRWESFRVFMQGSWTGAMKDTIVPGSGIFAGNTAVEIGRRSTLNGHWGAEYVPFKQPDLCVKFWGGGYIEDTGVQGGFTRYHNTAGFQYSPWFFDFSFAVDRSQLYDNFSVGLGVDLLNIADRWARKRGWKLPE